MSSGTTTTSSTQTATLETANTTVVPIQWITVGQAKSVDYYLNLLEANGTDPYARLGEELQELPDRTNATAVAQITYLALNATNPEVKEAFRLMMNGGTPDPSDFQYPIPQYNTELQVLYWLACQNEFKKDDTLALTITMVNGLWVTMGNEQVREAVYNDTNQLLRFLRETNQLQETRGYFPLEAYPLEAKVALAWTGGLSMQWQGPLSQPKMPLRLEYYTTLQIPLVVYQKDTVSVNTLRRMREVAEANGWWSDDANADIASMEEYFFFTGLNSGVSVHWQFATFPQLILDANGLDASMDVNWQFQRYLNGSHPEGDCGTETVFINAWAKSMGIATVPHWMYKLGQTENTWRSHSYTIYFDPARHLWTAYWKQPITWPWSASDASPVRYFIFRPPVDQRGYLQYQINWSNNVPDINYAKLAFYFKQIPYSQTVSMVNKGIDTAQMKQWLLYS